MLVESAVAPAALVSMGTVISPGFPSKENARAQYREVDDVDPSAELY